MYLMQEDLARAQLHQRLESAEQNRRHQLAARVDRAQRSAERARQRADRAAARARLAVARMI